MKTPKTPTKKEKKDNPILKSAIKMAMTKEAIASCALDGETQCGTIEPTKERPEDTAFRLAEKVIKLEQNLATRDAEVNEKETELCRLRRQIANSIDATHANEVIATRDAEVLKIINKCKTYRWDNETYEWYEDTSSSKIDRIDLIATLKARNHSPPANTNPSRGKGDNRVDARKGCGKPVSLLGSDMISCGETYPNGIKCLCDSCQARGDIK